jgi:hypothetical protein
LGKRAKRQLSFSWFGEEEDSKHTSSSTTEGKGLFGFNSGNLLGELFGGFDGSDKKSDSRSTEATSSTKSTSEIDSGETLQATTTQDFKHRNRRSTASDNLTDEANVGDLEVTDEESTTDKLEVEEDVETNLPTAAARRPGQLQHHISDDEDYFSEAASGSGMEDKTVAPTSAAPPTDRQPSEYCTSFRRVWHTEPDQDLPKRGSILSANNFLSNPPVM